MKNRQSRSAVKAKRIEEQPVKHSETVRAALEDAIVSGKLIPGSRLDEEMLAGQFGVSRTPVREALLQLATSGLVHTRPRQSATVAQLTTTDILMHFEFSLEIECICARLSSRRMTSGERDALKSMMDRMRRVVRKRDLEAYVEFNHDFHQAIYAGSHNRIIESQARGLFAKLSPYRRQILLRPGQIEISLRQHEVIARAIAEGDESAASISMATHSSLEDASLLDVIAVIGRGHNN